MGQYHYLINLDKRQVVHPPQIGNCLKLHEQIGWPYSTATVLVMLLAASSRDGGRGGGDFCANHPLIGAWAGDRIAFVGDYASHQDLPGFDAPLIYEQCNAACHPHKSDKPHGWEMWTDISAQVREMMSAEFGISYQGDERLTIIQPGSRPTQPPPAS